MAQVRIGISGWQYSSWRGEFYPEKLPQRRELEYASRVLNSVELNGTFYSLKSPASFEKWHDQTPDDFLFAVKGSRFITHMKRLRDAEASLGNFFANGVLKLGRKLGPFLWQLPPNMQFERERVEAFCAALPRDTEAAVKVARKHDERVKGRTWFDVRDHRRLRHAFEVRDPRFLCPEFIRILRKHGHALVFADTARKHPYAEDITAGFIYVRLHGATELYSSGYTDRDLDWWASRIRKWVRGGQMKSDDRVTELEPPKRKSRDIHVYFDNDEKVHAPFDALSLAGRLDAANDPDRLVGADGSQLPVPPRLARK